MSESVAVELGELTPKIASVNPAKFPEEVFDLLSIPAYDAGSAQIVTGAEVGSNKQLVEPGDVMISKIVPHIRRVWVVPEPSKKGRRQLASGEWIVLRTDRVLNRWLRFYLLSDSFHAQFMNTVAGVGGSLLRARPQFVKKIKLTIPPLAVQEKEAEIEELKAIIQQKRERQQELFEELKLAFFHDLFGNYNENMVKLGAVADIISGITKGRKTSQPTREIPYLAVANVQAGSLKLDNVKVIEATEAEIEKYRLQKGDIILTEGGDPDKLGRGTVWNDELPEVIHQNHIFRVRLHTDSGLTPDFVEGYLSDSRARKYFLKSSKQTTGIASINKTQLSSLTIPIPQSNFIKKFNKQNEVFKNI